MEKKVFDISHIQDHEKLNQMILKLNKIEQVSHIKIGQDDLSFECIDIERIKASLLEIDAEIVIKEVINGRKRLYRFKTEMKTRYFMFKHVTVEDDIYRYIEELKKTQEYEDIKYDSPNKVLSLESDQKNPIASLKSLLKNVNPTIEIYEYKKPLKSQDVFKEKYLKRFEKIGVLVFTLSLAIVSQRNSSPFTTLFYGLALIVFSESILNNAYKRIRLKKFLHEDVIITLAMIMAVISSSYIEAFGISILYQLFEIAKTHIIEWNFRRINETIKIPEVGVKVEGDKEFTQSLYEFQVNDIIHIQKGQSIPISGIITKGESEINTYSHTSELAYAQVKVGDHVQSGDVNVVSDLYIQIESVYEDSHFTELVDIASRAPMSESKVDLIIQRLTYWYTPVVVVIALLIAIVVPFVGNLSWQEYVHIAGLLLIVSNTFSSEQSTAMTMLSGIAQAFKDGIVAYSTKGIDAINTCQTIIYDRFDGVEVNEEELNLFKKLSKLGRTLIIFNDGPIALENDQYIIYNDLTVEEKLEKMEQAIGPVVYIGDSSKDIELLQTSYVGISRGGITDSQVVENSDIVLVDPQLSKVYKTFRIARKMRSISVINVFLAILLKVILMIVVLAFTHVSMIYLVLIEMFMIFVIMNLAVSILE